MQMSEKIDQVVDKRHLNVKERREALEAQYPSWTRHTVASHFEHACLKYQDRPFLYIEDTTVTYGEVWEKALRYAKSFLKSGVRRRDHIAVLMENDQAYPSLMIAASLIGAVFIPLNTMLSEYELSYILRQSDTRFLIIHETVKGRNHAVAIEHLLDDPKFQANSKLSQIICLATDGGPVNERFIAWDTFCKHADTVTDKTLEDRIAISRYSDEISQIMYTSGSTGKPKGVMLTHDHLLRSAYSTCLSRAIEDGRVTFAPLPFYHCFAIVEAILAMSFVGGSVISASRFTPLSALEQMDQYKANDFLCVPTMLIPLLNEPSVSEFDLSHLYAMWCGAAPAPVHVWERATETLGLTEICTGYGQTEVSSSGVITEMGDPLERISTRVGRPKLGGVAGVSEFNRHTVQYKTIEPDTGQDLPTGAIGELVVRGNTVTSGYYNKPDETARAIDKDGWLRTGDVGQIDEYGYVEHLGRSNDLYKVSGELVAPREVEEVIAKHPAVNQIFIVGVPDRMTTEAGAAFIELHPNETCQRKDIVNWCSEHVARFKVPRHVWFIESSDWPMTSTGKIQKFRLQKMAMERLGKHKK